MADPILGLNELLPGAGGILSQNERNLVLSRLLAPVLAGTTYNPNTGINSPGAGVVRGDLFVVSSSPDGAGLFAGQADKVAIARDDDPTSAGGYLFMTPVTGMRVVSGDGSTQYYFNGTTWA